MRVLVLGGTAEARALAAELVERDVPVVSSLAGRVSHPRLPPGQVRIGGFGGAEGLAAALREGGFTHLVDATHPFATTMTANAAHVARLTGIPALRLARPGWADRPGSEGWHWVRGYAEARARAERLGERRFLTTGRQTLPHFSSWADRFVLVRLVEPPDQPLPGSWAVLLDRGPFEVESEKAILAEHGIEVLVTKDSGGPYTSAKLTAADAADVPIVVVVRPPTPAGIPEVASVGEVIEALSG